MSKRETIKVRYDPLNLWYWEYRRPGVVGSLTSHCTRKASALRSARAFASKFVNPPEVTVGE